MNIDADSAKVRVPPPLILLISIAAGLALHFMVPLRILATPAWWMRLLGAILTLSATATIVYCATLFKKHQTHIEPWKPTTQLIGQGVYRKTRNPIYLSFVVSGLGLALLLNSAWMAFMMLPLVSALQRLVITKEERYLEQKFGEAYLAYKRQVRRWL